jgi:hypothetical protein
MALLSRDLRIAVRELLKSPGFVAAAVLMLAMGIGATTAIYSIVEGVLLRSPSFPPARPVDGAVRRYSRYSRKRRDGRVH